MKLTGFILEHDYIPEAVGFEEITGGNPIDSELLAKVIAYLENGEFLTGWLTSDQDRRTYGRLCPNGYYTDGVWVWPAYYIAYLKKYPDIRIQRSLVDHMTSNNFINNAKNLPKDLITKFEKDLTNKQIKRQ